MTRRPVSIPGLGRLRFGIMHAVESGVRRFCEVWIGNTRICTLESRLHGSWVATKPAPDWEARFAMFRCSSLAGAKTEIRLLVGDIARLEALRQETRALPIHGEAR